jgi:hypothetical protein
MWNLKFAATTAPREVGSTRREEYAILPPDQFREQQLDTSIPDDRRVVRVCFLGRIGASSRLRSRRPKFRVV